MAFKNYSKKSRNKNDGNSDNFENSMSYDPIKRESIDYENWETYIAYYRHHIDEFAVNVLGLKLYPFQRLILRAMARYQYSMLICCRGIGKSWLSAVFFICAAILYPGIKLGIASGKGQQARNVIIQKIKGELAKHEDIAREINFPIKTGSDDCVVNFKNGSEIRAIVLGNGQSGDSARSWRFHYLLCDEARIIPDDIIETILIPMTKTKRPIAITHSEYEKGKVIFISSAYLKTSSLYKRFMHHYKKMVSGDPNYFVCTLPYQVGVDAGIFDEDDILSELEKPTMNKEKFDYEYRGVFVGSSGESYYPYELTQEVRTLEKCELEQPKKSKSEYIIVHDVATSTALDADQAVTTVIKLKPKVNGTFTKEVVYMKANKGLTLQKQRDFLRYLVHIRFPNTIKLVIDSRGNGENLPHLFYETWEYVDEKNGQRFEFPPLIKDDDQDAFTLKNSNPLIRAVTATNQYNNIMYPYMKSCFEDGTLRLLVPSEQMDILFKTDAMTAEEFAVYIETDLLLQELSNIKQMESNAKNIIYERIVNTTKRDRVTSLGYGLHFIYEMEMDNKLRANQNDEFNYLDYLYISQ
ncbi:hypothetical protein G9G63_09795 [Paenibacillus sp. EKM202P]|uniref:terminase large subunit domain-containing protein n=1 Tax=unclassified Paenibacillus TaxID=185978 RepID=UPI0013E9F611|nr:MULTISPECIES: terminase family protein [unclassified Paenibacillus]KAF6565440.1 hypothetical protein G9G63_09795 [Paenibacillus sp. EKM202P]KAF6569235.1 hypothetical protein G9G64_12300 [Paenibacillus sp. EKM207P]